MTSGKIVSQGRPYKNSVKQKNLIVKCLLADTKLPAQILDVEPSAQVFK